MKSQACTKKISYESQAYSIKLCMVTCSNGIEVKKTFDFTYSKSKAALYCLGWWLFTNILPICTTSFSWLYSINIYVEVRILWRIHLRPWRKALKILLLKTNLHIFYLPNVVICCCIPYNMILDGNDLYIEALMI